VSWKGGGGEVIVVVMIGGGLVAGRMAGATWNFLQNSKRRKS
jgi:hypothetical protein